MENDKLKEAIKELFNSPCLKNTKGKEEQIERIYELFNTTDLSNATGNIFTIMFLQHFFFGHSPVENTLFNLITNRELSKEEIKEFQDLNLKRCYIEEVLHFLNDLPSEDSTDFYSAKYPEIYRHLWRVRDILIEPLKQANIKIQHDLEQIDKGFENIGNNPLKTNKQ